MAEAVRNGKQPLLSFEFVPDKAGNTLVRYQYKGTSKTHRNTVRLKDFLQILLKSYNGGTKYFTLGVMPNGYVNGAIGTDGSFKAVIFVPGKMRCLNYFNSRHFFIPFPDLYFAFSVAPNGTIRKKICYARKGKSRELYRYPFGNVNCDGNICMGNIKCKAKTMKDLEQVIEDFFMSVTNDDLCQNNFPLQFQTQLNLLETLEKKGYKKYPDNYLVSNGKLVTDLVNDLNW